MPRCDNILQKAQQGGVLRFSELCYLAECHGFELKRTSSTHCIYKRSGYPHLMNFQPDRNNEAKKYQVRQLLNAIEELT